MPTNYRAAASGRPPGHKSRRYSVNDVGADRQAAATAPRTPQVPPWWGRAAEAPVSGKAAASVSEREYGSRIS